MSPILLVVLGAVGLGLLTGGSFRALERLRLHWWGLAILGLALQVAPIPAAPILSTRGTAAVLLIASYLILLACLLLNRRVPGAPVMVLGLVLNLAVVGANAGMPVSAEAIQAAGGAPTAITASDGKHHLMSGDDVLKPLGDVIPLPQPLGVVLSIGDIFLYAGVGWFVLQVMRGRSRVNPRPIAMWFLGYRGKHAPPHWRLAAKDREHQAAEAPQGTGR
jgi:uncharacterized protein DUF5317